MKLFCLLLIIIPSVLSQVGFGRSYLKNSRLCHQWNCINTKLGLPDSLPPITQIEETLKHLVPEEWHDSIGKALKICYGQKPKQYTNTCPGQAIFHCVVDQMIENCPEESLRKNDGCSPVSSLAGWKYMFSQSRYNNLERNLPVERRPTWFMKNYFDSKCCDLPVMFNTTFLEECGFSAFMTFYTHPPVPNDHVTFLHHAPAPVTTPGNGDTLKIVDLNQLDESSDESVDPLDCCDMSDFIQPSWRTECDFKLTWGGQQRLVIENQTRITTEAPTTTTEPSDAVKDLMLVPQTCEKETCVFQSMDIQNSGVVDLDAYLKMLDNFTSAHPSWNKAKARVVTKCLKKRLWDYQADCEINKILACTLDVLTENCPYTTRKTDNCKHGNHKVGCQISSSKYRPKYRREICLLPELIHHDHLSKCGLDSLYLSEHVVVETPRPRKNGWMASKFMCKDSTASSTCMMNKMGILNKYSFMDYFKMKDRIRSFTSDKTEWSALLDIYMSAFINIPMYREHCSSQKKLLNVLDSMLMTCPISKRRNTPQCNRIFTSMMNTTPLDNQNVTKAKIDEILNHYRHVFIPNPPPHIRHDKLFRKKQKNIKKPMFNYGLLDNSNAPDVKVIDVKPTTKSPRPMVLLPVYMRPVKPPTMPPGLYRDGVFRGYPYWLENPIVKDHYSTHPPLLSSPHNNLQAVPRAQLPVIVDPMITIDWR